MIPRAVGFDDQSRARPEEVHEERTDSDVDLWPAEAVTAAEGEEAELELARGTIVDECGGIDREASDLGVADRSSQVSGREGSAKVLERALRCGDPDGVADGRGGVGQ